MLFDVVGKGSDQVAVSQIDPYAKKHAKKFRRAYDDWVKQCKRGVKHYRLRDDNAQAASYALQFLAGILFFAVIGTLRLALIGWSFLHFVVLTATVIIIVMFSLATRKRTRAGAELHAYTQALKRWLEDFTQLEYRPPTDSLVWGQFMTYAVLLGVSQRFIKNLEQYDPEELHIDSSHLNSPWLLGAHYRTMTSQDYQPPLQAFGASLSSSISAVTSPFSSTGGSGGGYSAGGGAGFGGGAR